MGTTALGTTFGSNGRRFRHFQQVVQLQRFDARSVKRLALVFKVCVCDTLTQVSQLGHTFRHQITLAEYTEVVLHHALQLFAQSGHRLTTGRRFPAIQTGHRFVDVGIRGLVLGHALTELVFNVQTRRTPEYHQIQQRVTAETVRTVYRYTGYFTDREETVNKLVFTFMAARQLDGLTMNVGGDTTHHVVTGWYYRDRLFHRIGLCEGNGQFTDARQAAVQHFFTQVIQLQEYVITIRAGTTTVQNFHHHGTGNNVTGRQIFGVRRVTLHEALAVLVDQVATLTPATLGYQHTGASDAGRVELPHFNVLHRQTSTQGHAHAVTGVDQGIGGRGVDTTGTTGGKDGGLGLEEHGLTGLDVDGDHTTDITLIVLDQFRGIPLVVELGAVLQVLLIQGVQQRVTGTVSSSTGTSSLTTFTEVLGLTTKRALVDTTFFGTGERQTHMIQLEHRFRADITHVFDSVLVTDVIGTFNGIVHVPAPIIVGIGRRDRTGDTALGGYSVRTGREYFGNQRSLEAGLGHLQ